MKRFRIYGASDDLIEVDGDFAEEYNADKGTFTLATPDGVGVRIHIKYEDTDTWRVGLHLLDEDKTDGLRDWSFDLRPSGMGRPPAPVYSAVLDVVVPDETVVLTWDGDA